MTTRRLRTFVRRTTFIIAALSLAGSVAADATVSLQRSRTTPGDTMQLQVNPHRVTTHPDRILACGRGLTQSLDRLTISGGSPYCPTNPPPPPPAVYHTEQSFIRRFLLSQDHGIGGSLTVNSVDIGIGNAVGGAITGTGTQDVTVLLYTLPVGDALDFANPNLLQIGIATVAIPNQTGTFFNVPVSGTVAGGLGTDLVVEVYTPEGAVEGNYFTMGTNDLGQIGPSYIWAPNCGVDVPASLDSINFPGEHFLMEICYTGAGVCGDGNPDFGEACDDGNTDNSDACSTACTPTKCGDGVLQNPNGSGGAEQCDDGAQSATCEADCTFPVCGDDILNGLAGEQCERFSTCLSGDAECGVCCQLTSLPAACANRVTHSTDPVGIVPGSIACAAGGLHTDNSYIRRFLLATDHGITTPYQVSSVQFGVENAASGNGCTQPIELRVYAIATGAPLTFANMGAPLATIATTVPETLQGIRTIAVTPPVTIPSPVAQDLVIEIFTPNGQTAGHAFFVGSNDAGAVRPSYLAAAGCGFAEPTDLVTIGYPDMHLLINVCGSGPTTGACCNGGVCSDGVAAGLCLAGGGNYQGNASDCATVDCLCGGTGGGCAIIDLTKIDTVVGYRPPASGSAYFEWNADASALEYHVNYVNAPMELIDPTLAGNGIADPACGSTASTSCTTGPYTTVGLPRYFQVLSACDATSEGPF